MLFVNVSTKGERNGDFNCPLKKRQLSVHQVHEAFYLLLLCLCSSYHLWLNLKYLLKTLASFPASRSGKRATDKEPRCHAS